MERTAGGVGRSTLGLCVHFPLAGWLSTTTPRRVGGIWYGHTGDAEEARVSLVKWFGKGQGV